MRLYRACAMLPMCIYILTLYPSVILASYAFPTLCAYCLFSHPYIFFIRRILFFSLFFVQLEHLTLTLHNQAKYLKHNKA